MLFLNNFFRTFFTTLCLMSTLYSQVNTDKKFVAIFPFHFASTDVTEKEALSEMNGLFYDLFAGQLSNTDYFQVVDRRHIMEMIEEIKLQQSGLTDGQIVEVGKMHGAQLAIFGTVTKVFKETYLTLKIIDIETSVIIKAVKVKGSLAKPDELALNAGIEFMNGLSRVLFDRYRIGTGEILPSSRQGLESFLKARDLIHQAILAKQEGRQEQKKKFLANAEKLLDKSASCSPELKTVIQTYRENTLAQVADDK
jgi:TolB-like protein